MVCVFQGGGDSSSPGWQWRRINAALVCVFVTIPVNRKACLSARAQQPFSGAPETHRTILQAINAGQGDGWRGAVRLISAFFAVMMWMASYTKKDTKKDAKILVTRMPRIQCENPHEFWRLSIQNPTLFFFTAELGRGKMFWNTEFERKLWPWLSDCQPILLSCDKKLEKSQIFLGNKARRSAKSGAADVLKVSSESSMFHRCPTKKVFWQV